MLFHKIYLINLNVYLFFLVDGHSRFNILNMYFKVLKPSKSLEIQFNSIIAS